MLLQTIPSKVAERVSANEPLPNSKLVYEVTAHTKKPAVKGLSVPTRKAAFKVAQACSKKKAISVLAKKSQTAQCKVTREKATHLVPTKIVGDVPRSRN